VKRLVGEGMVDGTSDASVVRALPAKITLVDYEIELEGIGTTYAIFLYARPLLFIDSSLQLNGTQGLVFLLPVIVCMIQFSHPTC